MQGTLLVTPEQLMTTANSFETEGSNIGNLLNNMMNTVDSLSSVWEGETGAQYINRFHQLDDDIQRMLNMIREHVTDLNDMAMAYNRSEAEAQSDIQSLSIDVII